MSEAEILRATVFHTPANPFLESGALKVYTDGGLLVNGGRIEALADFNVLHLRHPRALVLDLRGGFLLPGFIDTHVHYPQIRVLGHLGYTLLDWLTQCTLPEEVRMSSTPRAREVAGEFLDALVSHGTTTALVFGSHFYSAMSIFFDAAMASGLRIVSGLVVSDRLLLPALHVDPERAYRENKDLIRRYHGRGGLAYAVTPRFALSTTDAMLEVCRALLTEHPDLHVQSHINENCSEVEAVARLFPWASDYLAVYEKFHLARPRAVFAHNVQASDSELARLAASGAAVAHCPCSNAALGSGFFPMARHLKAGVRFALGTDVGGGTGFGLLKEAMQAYLLQRLLPDGVPLTAAHLLYLSTRAGAEALGLEDETGDFTRGKSADIVYLRPVEGSPLDCVASHAESAEAALAALFTLAGAESVRSVWVRGKLVHGG